MVQGASSSLVLFLSSAGDTKKMSTASSATKNLVHRRPPMKEATGVLAVRRAFGFPCALPFCRACPPTPEFMLCGVANPSMEAVSDGDSDSDNDSSPGGASAPSYSLPKKTTQVADWKDKLLKASNIASLLCVLDCTILPIVTILLPLFGIVAASPAQMEWLHQAGHAVALGFVMPVGGLATMLNYLYAHRTAWIASLGCLGLVLVLAANAGCSLIGHGVGGVVGHALHSILHTMHHGITHRIANLAGCALLLFSNYLSHRRQHAAGTCAHHGSECDGHHD